MKFSDFFAKLNEMRSGLFTQSERHSHRYNTHAPSRTKRSKRSTREHNRLRNRIARESRRINRRRAAG